MDDIKTKLGENLVGVIKAVVREELGDRERMAEEMEKTHRVGLRWSDQEEENLAREVRLAAEIIAVLHKRNVGGIRQRFEEMYKKGRFCGGQEVSSV